MNGKRLVVAVFGVAVAAVTAYVAYRFVAALTVAVFIYYSTRRFYRMLGRLRLPKRIRAATALLFIAVPLIFLISYTVVLLVVELRTFVTQYPVVELLADNVSWLDGVGGLPELTVGGMVEAYRVGELDPLIEFAADNASFLTNVVTAFFLNLLIVVVITYYLLIDGDRARQWLLRFDEDAIVREYLEAADRELEAVLFGNLLNVIAISIIAIAVFMGYNAVAPAAAEVPYPALAGALTGVASLIPVVGMKIVYFPLAAVAGFRVALNADTALLTYVVAFVIVAVVLVDTIPDLILRPYLSGETTHVGLLMLSYIFGPVVFGFYGLFLAPIILVLGLTFANTALPRLLGVESESGIHPRQRRLDEF